MHHDHPAHRADAMVTVSDVRNQPGAPVAPDVEQLAPGSGQDAKNTKADTSVRVGESSTGSTAGSEHLTGDPRALLAVSVLAAAALMVMALFHARLAFQLGLGGSPISRGQLFFVEAVISAVLAAAMFSHVRRVWTFAVAFSGAGLGAILASVYFPIAAVGPLPAIDEPTWLLSKAACALAELTVIALWLIRQIAPPSPPD
jgi:hypothetical protein